MGLQRGDRVVYGIHGVCCILDLELRTIDRKKVEYYVLSPLEQPEARFYVPTQNQVAVSKLRPLLSKEELDALLQADDLRNNRWIADENQRKQKYRELISAADRAELLAMVCTLHLYREEQLASGRKFHLCDENFLRDAEKLLCAEFAIVLNIPKEEVKAYIHAALR